MQEAKRIPRAQEVLSQAQTRPFKEVTITHRNDVTTASVVMEDGLPLFGVGQGTLRSLQDALGNTHPMVRDITAEPRDLGEKSYTAFKGSDGEKWVALGVNDQAIVQGVEYVLFNPSK